MMFKEIISKTTTKDNKEALLNELKTVFNKSPLSSSLILSSLIFFTAPSQATEYQISSINSNVSPIVKNIFNTLDIGPATQLYEEVSNFSKNIKNIVIIMDSNVKELQMLNEFNIPLGAYKYSHMNMVSNVISEDLNYFDDRTNGILELNVFDGENIMLNTAFSNLEYTLEKFPNKNFIVNMSLEGGVDIFGNVSFHDKIISLIKRFPNLSIVKSAGNSTAEESQLHSIARSIKLYNKEEFI